jgi:hypothetical protein
VDDDEMYELIEKDAEELEEKYFKLAFPSLPVFNFEIN